jgi:hypothetical protein
MAAHWHKPLMLQSLIEQGILHSTSMMLHWFDVIGGSGVARASP